MFKLQKIEDKEKAVKRVGDFSYRGAYIKIMLTFLETMQTRRKYSEIYIF